MPLKTLFLWSSGKIASSLSSFLESVDGTGIENFSQGVSLIFLQCLYALCLHGLRLCFLLSTYLIQSVSFAYQRKIKVNSKRSNSIYSSAMS